MQRDRHGRGVRGPLAPAGSPLARSRAQRFDELVIDTVDRLNRRWRDQLAAVEFAVEDVPSMEDWNRDWVPLARTYAATGALPTRVVIYRRPVETRATAPRQLRLLLGEVVAEQVAELLGVEPDEVRPTAPPATTERRPGRACLCAHLPVDAAGCGSGRLKSEPWHAFSLRFAEPAEHPAVAAGRQPEGPTLGAPHARLEDKVSGLSDRPERVRSAAHR